jgi:hypothetical protein
MSPPSVGQRRQQDIIGPASYSKPIRLIPAHALDKKNRSGGSFGGLADSNRYPPQRVVGYSRTAFRHLIAG